MKTKDFNYFLPDGKIAQIPLESRDSSRLMILNRKSGEIIHSTFKYLGRYLRPEDLLVVNRTRVIPARIFGRKKSGGRVEILLLRRVDLYQWECLVGGKGLVAGVDIYLEKGPSAQIIQVLDGARRMIAFAEPIESFLALIGHVPLPPYIHTPLENPERYQTIFAREPGSVAAPTAGLHFTPELISDLGRQGIKIAEVILHVGLDTFSPVTEENPENHSIHSEWCEISPATVEMVSETYLSGARVIAVGTTSVRTLESAAINETGEIRTFRGMTNLFILPGFQFKVVDGMITNFHLPKSTLLMLVSAFAGYDHIMHAYQEAIKENYRFFSFGDAMLIL